MHSYLIGIGIVVWLMLGAASHMYWWTKDYDYTTSEVPTTMLASITGPLSFMIGWGIHRDDSNSAVLFKRRK